MIEAPEQVFSHVFNMPRPRALVGMVENPKRPGQGSNWVPGLERVLAIFRT